MSSEVQAKWMKALARSSAGSPATRSRIQYSIALTSWLVSRSIALTRSPSGSPNAAARARSLAAASGPNGPTSGTPGSAASAISHSVSTRTRARMSASSLAHARSGSRLRA